MLTFYHRYLAIGGLFVSYIFFGLPIVLLVVFVVCVVACLVYFAPSAHGYNRTLGLSYGPNSTVAKPQRVSRSSTSIQPLIGNFNQVFPSENVTQNDLVISTPWGRTASSAGLRRRILAGKTMGSYQEATRTVNLNQPYETSASVLHRQPTTNSLSPSGGFASQVLSLPKVQQSRYGRVGSFPTVNLHPQPLPFLKERNTNMIRSPVTIKVGPSTKLFPSRADFLYGADITRPPDVDPVIATLGTRKRVCMSSNVEDVNEQAKRQRREDNAGSRSEFSPSQPVPSVLNGMLRSTANILMQQSASAGSQKRRFNGSTENLSVKRNRNNEISSSYSSSKRVATHKKKRKLSRSSSPSVKIYKGETNKSSEESITEEQLAASVNRSQPTVKPMAGSSPSISVDTSSVVSVTSENSNLSVTDKPPSIPPTPWSEGFSRKRQLPVYASVSASTISKPLYIPEASVSLEDDHRDLQASQARLQKIMAGVSRAFQAKDEKMKSQKTPGQDMFTPTIQSPEVPSPLSLGSSGFTTSTPVTSLQVHASVPADTSLTSPPTRRLTAVSSSGGLLSMVAPAAVTTAASALLAAFGANVSSSTTSATQLISPSLTFGFAAITTQSSIPAVSSVPKSNDLATSVAQSVSASTGTTAIVETTSTVPTFSSTLLASNTVAASSDPLPLGGNVSSSTNMLTSTPSSLPMPLFSTANAASTQKPLPFQMTTPSNLFGFGSNNFSTAASTEPLGNPPPYSAAVSSSASLGSSVTSSSFPSFAFSTVSTTYQPTGLLPTVSLTTTTTTTTAPQFSLTTTLPNTTGSSFIVNSPLTFTPKPQLEVGGLVATSSANPFTTSSFGVTSITGDKTSAFSQNAATMLATTAPTLLFGGAAATLANSNNSAVASTFLPPFGSGGNSATTLSTNAFNKPSSNSTTTPFFQASSAIIQTGPAQAKPLFEFGGSSASGNIAPQFQFGQNTISNPPSSSNVTSANQSAPPFSFGINTSVANPIVQFGQTSSASEVNSVTKPASGASLFQFGSTSVTTGSSTASSGPSFNFGSTNTGFGGSGSSALGSSSIGGGGFTFALPPCGASAPTFQPTGSSNNFFTQPSAGLDTNAFGTASVPSFGSGMTSTNLLSNGSNPSQPSGSGIFQFGTGAGMQPASSNLSAGFNFGTQPQQMSTTGFNFSMGTTPDLNFGGSNRNTVSSTGSIGSARRAAQARRRINR